jgi:FlaA1/EpsC-like NDP-sugar epimerase
MPLYSHGTNGATGGRKAIAVETKPATLYTLDVIPTPGTLDWSGFLARPQLPSPGEEILEQFRDLPILITGAGGSIGTALALRLAPFTSQLVLLESSESHLFALRREFAESQPASSATFVLGSVSESGLLDEIFSLHLPRLVFHAAAFKHVPLLEEHPVAAIDNNIFATKSLAAIASAHGARIILVSTDKAVAPASVMGATKRVAEEVVLAAGGKALRLGNVLASRDSVAELFARQIATGGPLIVTDPRAQRFFLTLSEAIGLLLACAAESQTAALFVPDLSAPHFIADLARFMARSFAPRRKIQIEFASLRPGDKRSEQLWSEVENVKPTSFNGLLSVDSPRHSDSDLRTKLTKLRYAVDARDSSAAIALLCELVPDYTPSQTVLSIRSAVALQAPRE